MANKDMMEDSTSLVIRKLQIETSLRYHFTPTKMAEN